MLKKKITILILCLAVMTVVSGCGKKGIKTVVEDNNKQRVEKVATTTKKINGNDWKVYRNRVSGYELRHPNSWNCRESTDKIMIDSIVTCLDKKGAADIHINVSKAKKTDDPVKYLKKIRGDSILDTPTPDKLNYKIAGVEGVRLSYQESVYGNPPFWEGITIVFIKNYKVFHIYIHVDDDGMQKDNIEKILQSLVVFDDEINISDWQTYRNDEYGYEMKYPSSWSCGKSQNMTCLNEYSKFGTTANIYVDVSYTKENLIDYLKKSEKKRIATLNEDKINYNIADVVGARVSHQNSVYGNPPFWEGISIIFIKDNKVFDIYVHVDEEGFEKNNIEKILQSLRIE